MKKIALMISGEEATLVLDEIRYDDDDNGNENSSDTAIIDKFKAIGLTEY